MKASIVFATLCLMAGSLQAAFENWTSSDGKTAELELIKVVEKGGEKEGEFRMRNGKTVTIKASDLSPEDAERLANWEEVAAAAEVGPASVFNKYLEGNLLRLEGRSLKRSNEPAQPEKYFLFYYTASWCGPCQAFTPSLVDFYEKHRKDGNAFEIVLISSDSDEKAMENYAKEKKMTWPHLRLSRTARFKSEFKHPGRGIPNLVLTDLEGNLLKTSYVDGDYKGPTTVMNHLEELLKQK